MKLDRNLNGDGRGKYGLVKNRRLAQIEHSRDAGPACAALADDVKAALRTLEAHGVLDWGNTVDTEFFVMKLRDLHTGAGLHGYAGHAVRHGSDLEYAQEVSKVAFRSGELHPNPKVPD